MVDPISLASGVLALATFAFQSSQSLYRTVESFQNNRKAIRELREELEALDRVLQSLQATADSNTDLTGLKLPLLRCGNACRDFEAVIVKCTAHSGGSRKSFRDWAKLTYMGDDIVRFKNMLAGYKATINIALGDATFRTVTVTVEVLRQYSEMITNTTSDLEEHLQDIDNRLENLSFQGDRMSDKDMIERERLQEERDSTEQCLRICAEVSEHMDQVQFNVIEDVSTASDSHQTMVDKLGDHILATQVTADTLKDCKVRLTSTTSGLKEHLQKINDRLKTLPSREAIASGEHAAEREKIQEEKESVKQCLAICAEASVQAEQVRTNVIEDVSTAHDGHQVIVATLGDLISARRITAGDRSAQWVGQMSDASLQQLSRDRGRTAMERATGPRSGEVEVFEDKYGAGHQLNSAHLPTSRRSSPGSGSN